MIDNRGFISIRTIAYACAVLLLVVVCVSAFRGYVTSSYMVKANRVAQKAYEGATECLDKQVKQGTMYEFNTTAKHFGKALSMELQEKILRLNYSESDVEQYVERYKKMHKEGDVRYLFLEGASIATDTRADNPIFDMLAYTITDDNVLEYTFLVEYNSVTGDVISVFYSSDVNGLSYDGEMTNPENVLMRNKELLTKKKQGYFGVRLNETF